MSENQRPDQEKALDLFVKRTISNIGVTNGVIGNRQWSEAYSVEVKRHRTTASLGHVNCPNLWDCQRRLLEQQRTYIDIIIITPSQ